MHQSGSRASGRRLLEWPTRGQAGQGGRHSKSCSLQEAREAGRQGETQLPGVAVG